MLAVLTKALQSGAMGSLHEEDCRGITCARGGATVRLDCDLDDRL